MMEREGVRSQKKPFTLTVKESSTNEETSRTIRANADGTTVTAESGMPIKKRLLIGLTYTRNKKMVVGRKMSKPARQLPIRM